MMEISGLKIQEKIQEGQRLNCFRARYVSNQKAVLVKVATHRTNNFLLETEYEICKNLNPEIILKPIRLESHSHINFLVFEDFHGKPLSGFKTDAFSPDELLSLFIKITKVLGSLHDSSIVHNDINPDNLWFDPATGQLKVSGLGFSINRKDPTGPQKRAIDLYSMAYLSPEQTGRTRIAVTQATDFYSLGCTLYQLASGSLPFKSQDMLELIHCHLAKRPELPHRINANIPGPVSDIIMKLLEKNPLDRYQSDIGLQRDLEICLTMAGGGDFGEPFLPGQHDVSFGLGFSKTLYDRQEEIDTLSRAIDNGNEINHRLILISGPAGMGKSALVEQVWKQSHFNGYFVIGKHDKISSRGAVQSAIESGILQILGQGKTTVKKWRDKILATLGNNAQLITDFVPMLEFVLGKLPSPAKLTVSERSSRLKLVLHKFIETIASKEKPLVVFLDDLQWIEPESIMILETIEFRPIPGFLIICAYRDSETSEHHPFIRTINKIKKNKIPVLEINLTPLGKQAQNRWVSDLLHKSISETRFFSEILFEKTEGNPFFIKTFLEHLFNTGLLYQTRENKWDWKLNQIRQVPPTDISGDFMIKKISKLDAESIELLKIAACLGSPIPITLVEIIYGKKKTQFIAALQLVINNGILIQQAADLTFVHDIVQESVYSMMPKEEQKQLHLRAGRTLLKTTPENEIDKQMIQITSQMNAAAGVIFDPEERLNLAWLNLKAGQNKMEISLLEAADRYFETGIDLLPTEAWKTDYALALPLFSKRCEILYVLGRYTQAESLFNQVLDHVEQPDHLLKIFEAKSAYLMQSYKAQEVIDTGLIILSKLGYKISSKCNWFQFFKEVIFFKKQLMGKKIGSIIDLPEITDPRKTAIIRTLILISRACALNGHPYARIVLFKSMRFLLTHGINRYAAYIFSFYGTVLSNLTYDLKNGYAFGQLAMAIIERFDAKKQEILTRHLFIVISINSLGKTKHHINLLSDLVKKSLKSDLFMNIFNLHVMYFFLGFISGTNLAALEQEMLDNRKHIIESNQIVWIHNLELLFQVVRALMGKKSQSFLLDQPTDIYDETSIHQWEKTNTVATISDFFLYRQIISYFLQGPEASLEYAKKGEPYFLSYVSLSSQMTHRFFYSLVLLSLCSGSDGKIKAAYLKKVKEKINFLKKIYIRAPENNPHMYFLIEAEMARIHHRFKRASFYYDKAMASANESGYLYVEAIACELAGRFFLENNQLHFANPLMLKAIECYKKWGVSPKVGALENQYAGLFGNTPPNKDFDNDTLEFKDVDIFSVLKASQAISREIRPDKLMERLIQLILENSGAQRAFLLLYSNQQMKIEAFAQTHPESVKILDGILVEKASNLLAGTLVYSVFLSRKSVILDDASRDDQFKFDSYIAEKKPVSILCMPILGKKSIQGVLYLENNLMKGAFSKQRLRILDLLITQVIISMENSRLYEKLRREMDNQILSTRKIKTHQIQLQKMSSQLAQTEERERKSIAEDLHDSVTQTLAMGISILKSMGTDTSDNRLKMAEIRTLLEQSLMNIRSLTFQLSSPILYDVGLEAALEWLCEYFFEKHGLQIRFVNSTNTVTPLEETLKITLYRAARELMVNIVKHGQTRNAVLRVSLRGDDFVLCIEDKGVGFDTARMNKNDGFGLFSITERIRGLKGKIHIHSVPGKGTKIKIEVPLPNEVNPPEIRPQ